MSHIRSENRAALWFLLALILGCYGVKWSFPPMFLVCGLMIQFGVRATVDAADETHGRA